MRGCALKPSPPTNQPPLPLTLPLRLELSFPIRVLTTPIAGTACVQASSSTGTASPAVLAMNTCRFNVRRMSNTNCAGGVGGARRSEDVHGSRKILHSHLLVCRHLVLTLTCDASAVVSVNAETRDADKVDGSSDYEGEHHRQVIRKTGGTWGKGGLKKEARRQSGGCARRWEGQTQHWWEARA